MFDRKETFGFVLPCHSLPDAAEQPASIPRDTQEIRTGGTERVMSGDWAAQIYKHLGHAPF